MQKRGFDLADGLSETKCKLSSNIKDKKKKQQRQSLQQVELLRLIESSLHYGSN